LLKINLVVNSNSRILYYDLSIIMVSSNNKIYICYTDFRKVKAEIVFEGEFKDLYITYNEPSYFISVVSRTGNKSQLFCYYYNENRTATERNKGVTVKDDCIITSQTSNNVLLTDNSNYYIYDINGSFISSILIKNKLLLKIFIIVLRLFHTLIILSIFHTLPTIKLFQERQ
jgi:hypothetical protein